MKIYRIAKSNVLDNFRVIGDKSKVTPELFWELLDSEVKKLTHDMPDRFTEVFKQASDYLSSQKSSLTIGNIWFEIKGK